MKIKNANEVKVGDTFEWDGLTTIYAIGPGLRLGTFIYVVREDGYRQVLTIKQLQALIDHGFEVTRKVEPVVVEARVCNWPTENEASIYGTFSKDLKCFDNGQRVRVTVEPID